MSEEPDSMVSMSPDALGPLSATVAHLCLTGNLDTQSSHSGLPRTA